MVTRDQRRPNDKDHPSPDDRPGAAFVSRSRATGGHRSRDRLLPEEMTDVRVGIYLRRSTDDEHQPYSIEAQEARLTAYVDSQPGWRIAARFSDDASGATLSRAGLTDALGAARAAAIDVLLVYRVDRLSRNLRDTVTVLDDLDACGVVFRSATEPFDTSSPIGRMLVQLLAMFAQFERDTIIDRVIAGMERKHAKGKWKGGRRPFGYQVDKDSARLLPDEAEAAIVRQLFTLYTDDRLGSKVIAKLLNSRGHRTTTGGAWSGYQVLRALTNRIYLGELTFRGVTVTGTHEPIIETELWSRAEEILKRRGDSIGHRASNPSEYKLTGKLRCPSCGRAMVGVSATGKSRTYRYYICHTRNRYDSSRCGMSRLDAASADQAITDALIDFYRHDHDLIAQAITDAQASHRAAAGDRHAELKAIDAELAGARRAIERYLNAFESGTLEAELLAERITPLRARAKDLEHRRAQIELDLDAEPTPPTPATLTRMADDIRTVIDRGIPNQIKALIEALIEDITVNSPDQLTPSFRIPNLPPSAEQVIDAVLTVAQNHQAGAATTAAPASGSGVRTPTNLVEVAGIEPASAGVGPGLLRAQPVAAFLSRRDPTGRSPSRAQSLFGVLATPVTGILSSGLLVDASDRGGGIPGLTELSLA